MTGFISRIKKLKWVNRTMNNLRNSGVWQFSTFITFYIFVTLFPLLVGIINGAQYYDLSLEPFYELITRVLPVMISERLIIDLEIIFERSNVGIFIIAVISTIWTISWIMNSIVMGLNKAYGVGHRKNIFILRLLAFFLTLFFALWFIALYRLTEWVGFNWLIFILMVFLTFCLLYYFAPNAKQKVRSVIPGALLATSSVLVAIVIYFLIMYLLPVESIFFTLVGSFTIILSIVQKVSLFILGGGVLNAVLLEEKYESIEEKNTDSKFIRILTKFSVINEEERADD